MYACIYCDPDFSCGWTIQPEVVQEVLADLKTATSMISWQRVEFVKNSSCVDQVLIFLFSLSPYLFVTVWMSKLYLFFIWQKSLRKVVPHAPPDSKPEVVGIFGRQWRLYIYDYNGKYDHDVRRIWKRKIGIADQMDMLHICINAYMHKCIYGNKLFRPCETGWWRRRP